MQRNATAKGGAKPKTGLTSKQDKVILALLSNPSIADAAKDAGVNPSTVFRWLQDEEFHAAYMKARHDSVKNAVAKLQSSAGDAVAVLTEIMNDKTAVVYARLTAAKSVLELSFKAIELEDLAQRVEELESLLKDAS
jgi:transposase-like protein